MITYIATAIIDVIVGVFALSRHDKRAPVALALFLFSLALWQTELYLLTVIKDIDVLTVWFHLTRTGMFFAPMMLALLAWRICGSSSQFFKKFILIPGFVAAGVVSLLNNTLLPSELLPAESGFLPKPDIILYLFLGIFLAGVPGSIVLAIFSYRRVPEREKRRIKWLLISLLWIALFSVSSIWIAAQGGAYLSGFLGAVSNSVFVMVLLYATINHHLTDVGSALSMLFARIIALGCTLGLYFTIRSQFEDRITGDSSLIFGIVFLIIALELYPRLLRLVHPSARKLMMSGGYDLHAVKRAIQVAFKRSLETEDLEAVLDYYLKNIMRVTHYEVAVVHKDLNSSAFRLSTMDGNDAGEKTEISSLAPINVEFPHLVMIDEADPELRSMMEKREVIACLPLIYEEDLVGILFVGHLNSYGTSYYRYDDIQLLEWLMIELPATLSRIVLHDSLQDDLDEAQKTMSMIELLNQYHHDIKAPLSIIDGVVSNDLYDRETQHKVILEQVARGTELITMMSNILHGQRERQTKPVNLQEIINGCTLLFEQEVDDIECHFEQMSDVVGDENDLKILFINLIKNSIEAKVADRSLKISITGGESLSGIWVSLKDNGCGMSKEQLAGLWVLSDTTKETGSGIGLRAVRRVVDEHGASIEVESEPNTGTTFHLRFSMRVQLSDRVSEGVEFKRLE